jgi:hypothetical protein
MLPGEFLSGSNKLFFPQTSGAKRQLKKSKYPCFSCSIAEAIDTQWNGAIGFAEAWPSATPAKIIDDQNYPLG